jgi:hypothetical protein
MRNFEKHLRIAETNLNGYEQIYFTPKQLFYEFCRTRFSPLSLDPKTGAALFGLSAIPAVIFAKKSPRKSLVLLAVSAGIIGALTAFKQVPYTLQMPFEWSDFECFLSNYLQKNDIEGLLQIKQKVEFNDSVSGDLTLYALPKLLICESDEIAQMLRANQFHLQTPCAVLSLREAIPLGENYQKMLANAEEPKVFFLHDASLKSFSKICNLREMIALNNEIQLQPIGLRPIHAKRLHLFAVKENSVTQNFDLSDFGYLTDTEKRWLKDGNAAEISAVSPVRLLRVLRRIISGFEMPPSSFQNILPPKNLGFMS